MIKGVFLFSSSQYRTVSQSVTSRGPFRSACVHILSHQVDTETDPQHSNRFSTFRRILPTSRSLPPSSQTEDKKTNRLFVRMTPAAPRDPTHRRNRQDKRFYLRLRSDKRVGCFAQPESTIFSFGTAGIFSPTSAAGHRWRREGPCVHKGAKKWGPPARAPLGVQSRGELALFARSFS